MGVDIGTAWHSPTAISRHHLPTSLLRLAPERPYLQTRHGCKSNNGVTQTDNRIILKARVATSTNFSRFGKLCEAVDDGVEFGEQDARLQLSLGTPRFYIMNIPCRGLCFDRITYHSQVTQCLGSSAPGSPWYLVVASPTFSTDLPPTTSDLYAFRIPHGTFVAMKQGLWHAGPFFEGQDTMSFFNLELADTNIVDHNTHVWEDLKFEIREPVGNNKSNKWWSDTIKDRER